ncbi:hypothetical protein [Georgenia sp. Z1491]|uniref:variant leucine-rich repeat-containing protein n=1 Tax=Georgenia sp. Z1491 TaxID=3416707 RepID=UPI003CEDC1F6
MTGTDDSNDPALEAADPATPLTRLQELAEHHPELRPAIAGNPSTYPGLLEWLGNLGDSEIDEAIAQRRARTAGIDPDEPATAPVRRPTAERFGAAGAAGAAAGGSTRRPTTESPAVEASPARPVTPPDGSPTTTRTPDAPPRQIDEPRRAVPWAGILAVAAALAVIVLGALWIFNLPGDDDQQPTTAGEPDPDFPPATTEAPSEGDEESPATDEIAEALAALEALPSRSDCSDAGPDTEVVQAFASAAAPDGTWGDPAHGDRVVDSLIALKDECGQEHAEAVVDMILGDSGTNPALRTAIEADMSWLEVPEIPADAEQMPGFWVQGANMACNLSGSDVVCTIVDHSLDTPEGCLPGGISVEISSDGEAGVNCNRSANADPLLSDGQSAYNGDLACTVTGVDVECWSTESGGGFRLGPSVLETY